jgi:hypothetical protein
MSCCGRHNNGLLTTTYSVAHSTPAWYDKSTREKPRALYIMPQTKRYTKAAIPTRGEGRKQSRRIGSTTGRKPDKRPLVGVDLERCLYCNKSDITKAGKRYTHHEIIQRWYCHSCAVTFSPRTAGKGGTYPLNVVLESLCHFYRGYTIEGVV